MDINGLLNSLSEVKGIEDHMEGAIESMADVIAKMVQFLEERDFTRSEAIEITMGIITVASGSRDGSV